MSKNWSKQQQTIFTWFQQSKGNLVIRARAGTGKTTTILEGITYASETNILLVAFNKSIATELQKKLKNPNAEAKTLHALGFYYVGRNWRGVKVDANRGEVLAERVCGPNTPKTVLACVRKLAGHAKNACPELVYDRVLDLAYQHDCFPDEYYDRYDVVDLAIQAAKMAATETGTIDFDDMIFVPVFNKWVRPKHDMIVVDEAQDMNPTQLLLARGACKGRMVIVGDDRQAIYGFRGADVGAIDRLKAELKAEELTLTITYRCPSLVVEYAQTLVPDFECPDNAPLGSLSEIQYKDMFAQVQPGDFVLSRKNAPLAGACLGILRAGKPAKISGKDVAKTLLTLINKWKDQGVNNFLNRLTTWEEKEIKKAATWPEKRRDTRIQLIQDQAETLRVLSDGCAQLSELRKRVENMFVDETQNPMGVVLCSSIHKAKGQERHNVYLFGETLYPANRDDLEEKNLEYVAVTRAQTNLIWVSGVTDKVE